MRIRNSCGREHMNMDSRGLQCQCTVESICVVENQQQTRIEAIKDFQYHQALGSALLVLTSWNSHEQTVRVPSARAMMRLLGLLGSYQRSSESKRSSVNYIIIGKFYKRSNFFHIKT